MNRRKGAVLTVILVGLLAFVVIYMARFHPNIYAGIRWILMLFGAWYSTLLVYRMVVTDWGGPKEDEAIERKGHHCRDKED